MGASVFAGTMFYALQPAEVKAGSDYDGWTSSTLPTTIDLNDTKESDVRSYYSSLNGKKLSGENLRAALKPILMNGQIYSSYDIKSNNPIWRQYEITDRDWSLSPASDLNSSSVGFYDAVTNKITDYKYGKSGSDPYCHLLYRNRTEAGSAVSGAETHAWSTHGAQGSVYGTDREHIWQKCRGFESSEAGNYGARGDLMHLWAGDAKVNQDYHNNRAYGFVKLDSADDASDFASYLSGNYKGTSTSLGSGDCFEPQDCDKGDIARSIFYMAARYNNIAGDDDTIDSGNPNLYIDDTTDRSTIPSTSTTPVSIGILRDLLAWHRLDPVDDYEIHRNNLLYNNYTKNRNPFIDFPDWVEAIWGSVTYDETQHKVTAHDKTAVGYADPEHDDVRTYGESWVSVTSIAVSNPTTEFTLGDEFAFGGTVTATMSDSSQQDVTSSCTFEGYDLDSSGNQTVTVTHVPSGVTTTYSITVTEPVVPVSISVSGQKTSFNLGDEFSFDGTVTLTYSDSSKKTVTDCTYAGYDMNTAGNQTVTVTHTSTGLTTTYGINIIAPAADTEEYTLIKDASELREGDKILLVATDSDKSFHALSTTQNKNNRGQVAVTVENDAIAELPEGACELTLKLGENGTNWSLYDPNQSGYLYAASSGNNYLRTQTTLDANGSWTIAVDENSQAVITAQGACTRNTLLFNRTSDIFACYAADSNQTKPYIFKSYSAEADNYGKAFINTYTAGCKSSGIGSTIDWNSASTAFAGLTTTAKGIFSSIAPNAGTAYRFQAVARYDYIVGKYGTGTYANFMGRSIDTNNGAYHSSSIAAFNWQSVVLVCLGTCVIASVGFFFLARKKKEA